MRYSTYVLALVICLVGGTCATASPLPPNLPGSWRNTFNEEFNAPLNSTVWKSSLWSLSNPSVGQEVDNPTAVTVNNGLAYLTASVTGKGYASGQINTGPAEPGKPTGYSFLYGYAQASIKLPSGTGLWPAFWLLPDPNPAGVYHDGDGEIDVMEEIGSEPTIDQVHLHQNGNQSGKAFNTGVNLSQGFHTYGVNWQPGKLDFYFDGKLVDTINQAPSVREYLIFDLAVGSSTMWPGAPDASTLFPAAMQIDNVQVWQPNVAQALVPEPSLGCALLALIPLLHRRRQTSVPFASR